MVSREIFDKGLSRFHLKLDGKDKGDLGVLTLSVTDLMAEVLFQFSSLLSSL